MNDHDPIRVTDFKGLFDRGEDEVCPPDHFISEQNLRFLGRGFASRFGTLLSDTKANLRRAYIYRIAGQAQRLLLLDSNGDIYDSTDLGTVILHVTGMTDFSAVTMYDRAYISPHDGVKGLAGEKLYVYTGSGLARAAAGVAPTGFTLTAADSATSGSVEAGTHVIAVAFETPSGYVTGFGGHVAFESIGDRKLDIGAIALGPTGTAARVLVATKLIADYNGDVVNQTYYLVPDGRVGDNTTGTKTINFFDADLQDEVSFLVEQLETIPAGVAINNYNGKLVVGGSNTDPSTLWASKPGEPESVSSVEGYCDVNAGDAGAGIKNLWVHAPSLMISKGQRTYYVIATDESAIFWKPLPVDSSVGAEPHSVGRVLDYGETVKSLEFIADRDGLYTFNGVFQDTPLSQVIEDVWARINKAYFHTVEVAVDSISSLIYCAVPLDAATAPSHLLVADYNRGLKPEDIRWSRWAFAWAPQSVVVDVNNTTKKPILKMAGYAGNVYKLDSDTIDDPSSTPVDAYAEFALFPHETSEMVEGMYHLGGMAIRARGAGALAVTARDQDSVRTLSGITIALPTSGEGFRLLDLIGHRIAVKIRINSSGYYFSVTRFVQFVKWVYSLGA